MEKKIREQLSEIIAGAILDGQNQIHDLNGGKATGDEVNQRMLAAHDYHLKRALLAITVYLR